MESVKTLNSILDYLRILSWERVPVRANSDNTHLYIDSYSSSWYEAKVVSKCTLTKGTNTHRQFHPRALYLDQVDPMVLDRSGLHNVGSPHIRRRIV